MISIHTWSFWLILAIAGLVVGSFLNVVIHRLPIMLKKRWQRECVDIFAQTLNTETHVIADLFKINNINPFNLALPRSHCPICRTPIKFWQNIPVLSYLLLCRKCAICKNEIPIRYLLVELLSLLVAIIAGLEFGISFTCAAVCIFGWFLIAISFIDIENQLIPDSISIPLLWIGLLLSCFDLFTNSHDAILGAIIGYVFLWGIGQLFQFSRKREGIGLGDCKLLAAVGAWLGWQLLPFVILTSSIFGLIIGSGILLHKKLSRNTPIPFAPFITIAAWTAIIWGFDITQYYLSFFGINWTNV